MGLEDLFDREDRLEEGEDLLECVGFLIDVSFRSDEGLLEGAVLLVCKGLLFFF